MKFLSNNLSSFEDEVDKITSPRELIQLWKIKENKNKRQDLSVVEARLAKVLVDVSDLKVFEQLLVLVDSRIHDWLKRIKNVVFSDEDPHISALGEKGIFLKHLIALSQAPNTFRSFLAESSINQIASVRPDLVNIMKKAITSSVEDMQLLAVLENRLHEMLADQISQMDDYDALAGIFDLASIGEGSSDLITLKSRELVVDRICLLIGQIDDFAEFKNLNVPKHPEIMEVLNAKMLSLLQA